MMDNIMIDTQGPTSNGDSTIVLAQVLNRIWNNLIEYTGEKATVAIFRTAWLQLKRSYPQLNAIIIDHRGLNLTLFQENAAKGNGEAAREALLMFTDRLLQDITHLAGPVLIDKITQ